MTEALAVLGEFAQTARGLGVAAPEIRAVATSAARRIASGPVSALAQ